MTTPIMRHIAGAPHPPTGAYDADVVILAQDRAAETIDAIQSALSQTGVSRHVIVVDQGSHPSALTSIAAVVLGRDDATLVALDRNLGVPGGRNLGTSLGKGRVIVGLDNDAVFNTPDTLARMVAVLDAKPGLAALGCRIVVDETGEDDLSSWGYPASLLSRAGGTFLASTFVGAGHAIRRAAWIDVGEYDASLFFCWEEYDFCLRAITRGWQVHYQGDIVVRHKVSPERRVTWTGDRWFHFVRNRLYIERKLGRSWLALTPRVIGYAVKALRNGCLADTPRAVRAASVMARGVIPAPLSAKALDYLWRTDTAQRGGFFTRLRREVLATLPARPAYPTDRSIRAITSAGKGPASAAATHSANS